MICGGNYRDATAFNKDRNGGCAGCAVTATDTCAFISPEANGAKWTYETMASPRVMPDAVLLLDDTVLIVNGAQKGFQGLRQPYASQPVLQPELYSTNMPVGRRCDFCSCCCVSAVVTPSRSM